MTWQLAVQALPGVAAILAAGAALLRGRELRAKDAQIAALQERIQLLALMHPRGLVDRYIAARELVEQTSAAHVADSEQKLKEYRTRVTELLTELERLRIHVMVPGDQPAEIVLMGRRMAVAGGATAVSTVELGPLAERIRSLRQQPENPT